MSVSTEMRLAYVLQHFWQGYEAAPNVTIGYPNTHPQLEIAEGDNSFFQHSHPYPPTPIWREWKGQRVPIFFDTQPEKPLLELLPDGRALIHADLISAAFYLLSGWQEYFCEERDEHGRFPYAASVQRQYGFVAVPVVNYYFDILRAAVEHITSAKLPAHRWGANRAPFAAFITHDIDNLHGAWKAPAKAALRGGHYIRFARLLVRRLRGRDAWNNLEEVQAETQRWGAKSTFFFLPEHCKAANNTPNADYRVNSIIPRIRALETSGAEIQLHASIGTSTDINRLHQEAAHGISTPTTLPGVRFHYLQWEPRITPGLVDNLAFEYDSTLGFAEHFGFRNAYCLPFYPFDFEQGKAFYFLEIPLNVMDASLHHPKYLQLASAEILPALTPMFQEIEKFGGVCTVLWHNENFAPQNKKNGPRQFAELMHYLRCRNVAFVNGADILQHLSS